MTFDPDYGSSAEPVITFRARDAFLPRVLSAYRDMCHQQDPDGEHTIDVGQALMEVENWQAAHRDRVVMPDPASGIQREGR